MFERFTDRARRVLVVAQEEARLLDHNFIGTEHLLLGLMSEGDGVAAHALESLGVHLDEVRELVQATVLPAGSSTTGSPPFTPRAKKVLELSGREAEQLGHDDIGTEHLLLGLVREGESVAAQVLVSLGADPAEVRLRVLELVGGYRPDEHDRATPPRSRRLGGRGQPGGRLRPRRRRRRTPWNLTQRIVAVIAWAAALAALGHFLLALGGSPAGVGYFGSAPLVEQSIQPGLAGWLQLLIRLALIAAWGAGAIWILRPKRTTAD